MKLHALSLLLVLLAACGGTSLLSGPLPADPDGVLLEGDAAALALGALQDMVPSAAPAGTIVDGLLTTRLEALIDVGATVADVNQALASSGAAIVSMRAGFPVVTLVVPPLSGPAEASALAAQLQATGGFGLVTPSYVPHATGAVVEADGVALATAAAGSSALNAIRMTPAKNAQGLLVPGSFPVLVPSTYSQALPSNLMVAQVMAEGPGGVESDAELGNWGFTSCGIIGTDPEHTGFDAVHPDPVASLELRSILTTGLTWTERVFDLTDQLPAGSFVLSTDQVYAPDLDERSKTWRIVDALAWRAFASDPSRFVHLTAAGDQGGAAGVLAQAAWASPFALSESFPSLSDLVDSLGSELTAEEQLQFDNAVFVLGTEPAPLGNLRIVGSSKPSDHGESDFSGPGADLRVVGEEILALCLVESSGCDGTGTIVTSTRAATAQVSGLFAWLWTLAPERTAAELLEIVDRAWFNGATPGLVDAYYATLALDRSLFDPRVRMELLDVAAGSDMPHPVGNGSLDHHDLKVFVDAFEAGTDLRYDLNGDGLVGGDAVAMFDLDVNDLPQISTVSQNVEGQLHTYDEAAVTDLEVLCYYAYSSLYAGDTDARGILLAECNGLPQATIFVDSVFQAATAIADVGDVSGSNGDSSLAYAGVAFVQQANASGLDDDSPASCSSSVNYQSSFETDTYGNLTRFTAGGSAAGEFSMQSPTAGAYSTGGRGLASATINFHTQGDSVPFALELNVDGAWSGDPAQGELGQVRALVQVYDGELMQYVVDELVETPTSSLPASFSFEGALGGGGFQSHQVHVQVLAAGTATFGQGLIPASIAADASCTWDFELTMQP